MPNIRRRSALNLSAIYDAFPFQADAFEVIKNLEFAAVFHEQGLGKTKIAIDLALHWLRNNIVDSVVVVTKKSLVENWMEEISVHTNLRIRTLSNDRKENHESFHKPAALYVTHYEAIKSEEERIAIFSTTRRLGIVLDESHKIKNPDARISQTFHRLSDRFHRRVILTGTPLANRPFDIWSQIWFLDRGQSLGRNFPAFKRELDIPRDEPNGILNSDSAQPLALTGEIREFESALGGLFPRISAFSVRETKDGAGIDLPKKHFRQIFSEWEDRQRQIYVKVRDEMRIEVMKYGHLDQDISEELLKRLLRLVQITSNPNLVDDRYSQEPGKIPPLRRLLKEISLRKEKAIIWTSFVANVRWLASEFDHYQPVILHGQMSIEQRGRSVKNFMKDDSVRVLIATPQSSKEGLTLTVANHVIFFDRTFSLDDYLQAQDRIHRISQDKECFVYTIIMNNSIELWVDKLISVKQAAASFGQGDIDAEEFQNSINYDLRASLEEVLSGN